MGAEHRVAVAAGRLHLDPRMFDSDQLLAAIKAHIGSIGSIATRGAGQGVAFGPRHRSVADQPGADSGGGVLPVA
jgi:hypothetical protein